MMHVCVHYVCNWKNYVGRYGGNVGFLFGVVVGFTVIRSIWFYDHIPIYVFIFFYIDLCLFVYLNYIYIYIHWLIYLFVCRLPHWFVQRARFAGNLPLRLVRRSGSSFHVCEELCVWMWLNACAWNHSRVFVCCCLFNPAPKNHASFCRKWPMKFDSLTANFQWVQFCRPGNHFQTKAYISAALVAWTHLGSWARDRTRNQ